MSLRDLCDTAYVLQLAGADDEQRDEFDTWLDSPFEAARLVSDRERQLTLLMGG